MRAYTRGKPGIYIKENSVSVGVSIMCINAIKSLRKLHVANFLSNLGVHQETHSLSNGLAIIYIMVTIQVQHERSIGKHCRDPNLKIARSREVSHKAGLSKVRELNACKINIFFSKFIYQGIHGTGFFMM
jgi:hypothetical protein